MHARNAVPVLVAALFCGTQAIAAVRCEGPERKTLYVDDGVTCPAGYRNLGEPGGTLSVIGKSEATRRQEESFLRSRAADARRAQQASLNDRRMAVLAENNRRANCVVLRGQLRQNETAMRQGDAWERMGALQAGQQAILDQQGQLGCEPVPRSGFARAPARRP